MPNPINFAVLTASNSSISGNNDQIFGDNNILQLTYSTIDGDGNQVFGDHDLVMGDGNTVLGKFNIVVGANNGLSGDNGIVHGDHNFVYGNNEIVVGNFGNITFDSTEKVLNHTTVQGSSNTIMIGNDEILSVDGNSNTINIKGSATINFAAENQLETLDLRHVFDIHKFGEAGVANINHTDTILVGSGESWKVITVPTKVPGAFDRELVIHDAQGATFDVHFGNVSPDAIHVVQHD